jgi:hypothetical protein
MPTLTDLSLMLSRIPSALMPFAQARQPEDCTHPAALDRAAEAKPPLHCHPSDRIPLLRPAPFSATRFLACSGPYIFIIAVTCSYYVAIAPLLLGHTDLGWHLAAGDLIRSQGSVPAHDPWSFTAAGKRWYNLSWLWDVGASLLFQYGGFTALTLATIFLGGLVAGILALLCFAGGATPISACIAVITASILYPIFAAPDIFLAASPNAVTLLFCVIFYGICLRNRHLWAAPVCMALWANMHGGFVLGVFILAVFATVSLIRRDEPAFRSYVLIMAACVGATLFNPLGWHVYEGVLGTLGHFVQQYITEWQPYYAMATLPQCIPACAYMLMFVVLELSGGNKVPAEARILSWCFLFLGLSQQRYLSIFFLFSPLPIALHLSKPGWRPLSSSIDNKSLGSIGLAVLCLLPFFFSRVVFDKPGLPAIYPDAEISYLEQHFPNARLLNHWNYGGILIFRSRGKIPVFVDGRAATAYPDGLLRDYFDLITWDVNEAAWKRVLQKYNIDVVLWPRAHGQLATYLVDKEKWTQVYSGTIANVYVKEP